MKSGCIFFSIIFLLNFLQVPAKVQCGRVKFDTATLKPKSEGLIDCTSSCAGYACANNDTVEQHGFPNNTIAGGSGCPEHFYKDCAEFPKAIKFIKENNENDIDYFDGNVLYTSGCEKEKNGMICLLAKVKRFEKQLQKIEKYNGEVIWNPSTSSDEMLNSDKENKQNSGLNGQNDAIKAIEIFAFSWVLYIFM